VTTVVAKKNYSILINNREISYFKYFIVLVVKDCMYLWKDSSRLIHFVHIQYLETILCSQSVKYSHSLQPVFIPHTKHFNSVTSEFRFISSKAVSMIFCSIGLEVFIWLPIFLLQDKCLAVFADLDQKAFPGNTSLPHSLHLALKVIVISSQSVIVIILSL
jgi:hypothetical protein